MAPTEIQTPVITVVIPVYNRRDIVTGILADLNAQSFRNFRVVLVDNASTDDTSEVLRTWAESTKLDAVVLSESRRGAAAARQRGLEAVDTEWTLFFDSDDHMAPDHINRVVCAIASHPEADLIGWDVWHTITDSGDTANHDRCKRRVRKHFATTDVQFHSLFHGTMATQRYCARTALFRAAGGWDCNVGVWDDIELGARLLALQPSMVKSDGVPTVTVTQRPDSISCGECAANIAAIEPALTRIAATLGEKGRLWTDFKRIILAANSCDSTLKRAVVTQHTHKAMLTIAYHYTRLGGRGIATLLRPFI